MHFYVQEKYDIRGENKIQDMTGKMSHPQSMNQDPFYIDYPYLFSFLKKRAHEVAMTSKILLNPSSQKGRHFSPFFEKGGREELYLYV